MKHLKKCLFITLCVLSIPAFSAVTIQGEPLSRNGLQLEFSSYEDSKIKKTSPYPDVLIVHGLTYSSQQFDIPLRDYSLTKALVQRGFRVWLLDITGYGASQKPKDGFTVDSNYAAEDINAAVDVILKKQKVKKVNVMGWSWGTITSSRFAVKHPEKVNKLVLYAPIIHGLEQPAPKTDYQTFSSTAATSDFQRSPAGAYNSELVDSDLMTAYFRQVYKYDAKGSPNGGRKDLFQEKTKELIPYKKLTVPVLFIAGDHDPYVSLPGDFSLLKEHSNKNSCQEVVKGGGHILFLEKPFYHQFQNDVSEFLVKGCSFQQSN
jgi:pimeloyl-ACP methyl ester carboxylesterase